ETARGLGGTWFFDEIQHVDGWQRWLRSELDRPRDRRFVVTGSNSALLAGELGSSLTGRHHLVELFPFDFDEFRVARPGASLVDYLAAGGFPAPLSTPDGDRLLQSYFNDIIERDMRERLGARSTLPLRQLVQMLYESAGSELSARRVATAIGITDDTTSLYLQAAEAAYLAFACPFFAWSERKRATRPKKYYPIDTGLRRVAVTRTGEDRGKQLECATYLTLRRRYRDVFYWRDKGEVDFVVLHRNKPLPVQVSQDGPMERQHQALDAFYSAHRDAHEAVFVSAEAFAAGLVDLPGTAG
ncbi:MAG: ATP-binding protein, partial [Planctomycetota bacterium]